MRMPHVRERVRTRGRSHYLLVANIHFLSNYERLTSTFFGITHLCIATDALHRAARSDSRRRVTLGCHAKIQWHVAKDMSSRYP